MAEILVVIVPDLPPVHMWDHIVDRNSVTIHQPRRQARGAIYGRTGVTAAIDTHLNPNGRAVTGPVVIGVLAALIGWEALVNGMIVHRVMPGDIADRVMAPFQCASLQHRRVGPGIGASAAIIRGMDRDVARIERALYPAAIHPFWNQFLCNPRPPNTPANGTGAGTQAKRGGDKGEETEKGPDLI